MQTIGKVGLLIDLLINNAGVGKWTPFLGEPLASYEAMINLNITSLMTPTYRVLPYMLAQGAGGIINIAATGSFQRCPYIATYCVTKAFVSSFSEALHTEYQSKTSQQPRFAPETSIRGFRGKANADTQGMRADSPQTVAL